VLTIEVTKPGRIGYYRTYTATDSSLNKNPRQCLPAAGPNPDIPSDCVSTPPAKPVGLKAVDVQQTTITLNWTPTAPPGGGYFVYFGGQHWETPTPQWMFNDLKCGRGYELGVAQHDVLYNISKVAYTSVQTRACAPSGSADKVTFNSKRSARVVAVSCGTGSYCAAGGSYRDASNHQQAFVVREKDGGWGTAIEVPATDTLNAGGNAAVNSVSCASAGNCAAGGYYRDAAGHTQGFVVSTTNGGWSGTQAFPVLGLEKLNAGGNARVSSIACASAGNCAAGGYYYDGSGRSQAFVVNAKNHVWGRAIEVPGSSSLNLGGSAAVTSISCATAGNCAAGGSYRDGSGHDQAFVVNETTGKWGTATEVSGTAALNAGGIAGVTSVSCASTGGCAAGGYYRDASGHTQAFVVSESSVWGQALEVPGSATLNVGGNAQVTSISCTGTGTCTAGGSYLAGSGRAFPFIVSEGGGTWGNGFIVPGIATLNTAGDGEVSSISCADADTCAAGGYYKGSGGVQAFVVSKTNGVWASNARIVRNTDKLNQGGWAAVNAISCPASGDCVAGGSYRDIAQVTRAFVTTPGAWLWTRRRPVGN
jgi:hypothetical protein